MIRPLGNWSAAALWSAQAEPGFGDPVDVLLPGRPAPAPSRVTLAEVTAGIPARLADGLPEVTRKLLTAAEQDRRSGSLQTLPVRSGHALVVIPAYDEQDCIATCLDCALKGLDPARTEVLLSTNGITDGTLDEIRAWAARHPESVDFGDISRGSGDLGPPDGSRLRVLLLDSPQPGKLGALVRPRQHLERQSSIPEFVLTLDADTRIRPGQLERLADIAHQGDYAAVSGKYQMTVPEGERLSTFNAAINSVHGIYEWTSGGSTLSRTREHFAVYGALLEVAPGVATEDSAFGALLRLAGKRTTVARDVPFLTRGESDPARAQRQMDRWMLGLAHTQALLGDSARDLGLEMPPHKVIGHHILQTLGTVHNPGDAIRVAAQLGRQTLDIPAFLRSRARARKIPISTQGMVWKPDR
ncbi:MAG: glycosyltransferase family 2 protein [Candidatus Eremiobacterota bacterium]